MDTVGKIMYIISAVTMLIAAVLVLAGYGDVPRYAQAVICIFLSWLFAERVIRED